VNPGRHGVFDFVQRDPADPDRRVPVSSRSIGSVTFLELLSNAGPEVRAGNIPVTFPPSPVRGRMISGVAVPPGARFVHPREWGEELQHRAPFPLNGLEWTRFADDPAALVEEARTFVDRRTASFEAMLEGDWDVAACVYVAPDRVQHPLGAYLLTSHPDHARLADGELGESIRDVYRHLDVALGRLRSIAGPEAVTVLMSDHGFRPVTRSANLNRVLETAGLAVRARTAGVRRSSLVRTVGRSRIGHALKRRVRAPSEIDWTRTVAYQSSAGPGVSVNLRGRERGGIVDPGDFDRVVEEVASTLPSFVDPESGTRPVAEVLRARDIYTGPYATMAPDLLVKPAPMWMFAYTKALTTETDWPSGSHRRQGIVAAAGPGIAPGDLGNRDIADLAPTVLAFCGVALPAFDGHAIEEISGPSVRAEDGGPDISRGPQQLTDEDDEFVVQHLRDLGYIE
jgi:predicted AlkP superfamily phosphohydrolase/phosphomutase